jgi:hypothetical protein
MVKSMCIVSLLSKAGSYFWAKLVANMQTPSNLSRNIWLGIGKNKDNTWTVMLPTGLQPKPFKNKQQALKEALKYMLKN